jgi:deoxyadenosine kinase
VTQSLPSPTLENAFIGIAGLIGVGKSTLCRSLAEHLDLPAHYEPVTDNIYLEDFYTDTARYSFAMQVYLLNRRFQQHQEIIWSGRGAVQDRTIYEDSIFARVLLGMGMMDRRDYETYVSLFKNLSNFMCRPNVIVYLDAEPQTSFDRIQERSRGCESGITLDYLNRLRDEYERFVEEISHTIPVIRVGWEQFHEVGAVANAISEEYTRTKYMRQVTL